jgi:plastocyanin
MSRTGATALACLMPLIAACGSGSGDPPPQPLGNATRAHASVAHPAHRKLVVRAREFSFSPTTIVAKRGKLKLTLRNSGRMTHELILLRTSRALGSLRVRHGKVSEASSVGEISETKAGKRASHTFELKPGHYVLVCNLRGHYHHGMRGRLTVK